jgi:hypothetical protein
MMVVPVPAAVTDAMMHAHTDANSGTDRPNMSAGAHAVSDLRTTADGSYLDARADLRTGRAGRQQCKREYARGNRFHGSDLRNIFLLRRT